MDTAYPQRDALFQSAAESSQILLRLTGISCCLPTEHQGNCLKSWLKKASEKTD